MYGGDLKHDRAPSKVSSHQRMNCRMHHHPLLVRQSLTSTFIFSLSIRWGVQICDMALCKCPLMSLLHVQLNEMGLSGSIQAQWLLWKLSGRPAPIFDFPIPASKFFKKETNKLSIFANHDWRCSRQMLGREVL